MRKVVVYFEKSTHIKDVFDYAVTNEEKTIGLSGQDEMKQLAFYYPVKEDAQNIVFIMPDMLFDLDLIFIDSHGVIRQISRLSASEPEECAVPPFDTKYVLEVQCGFIEYRNIFVGQKVFIKLI